MKTYAKKEETNFRSRAIQRKSSTSIDYRNDFRDEILRNSARANELGWGNEHLRQQQGGDPKKKRLPTNDFQADFYEVLRLRPQALPAMIAEEATREVEGVRELEMSVDLVIVNSPCYSAEIYAIIEQMKQGEVDFFTGKRAIRERLAYLLTNEFKNAEGQVNRWAEKNKGEGTVENKDNMGASWYRMGSGSVLYLALTDWNDASDPSHGANNYNIFKYVPPRGTEDGGSWQEYGNPLTSRDASGQSGVKTRARHVGNPIDITWIMRIINMLSPGGKNKSSSKKSWDQKGPAKTAAEAAAAEEEYDRNQATRQEQAKQNLLDEKMRNTIIGEIKTYIPGERERTMGEVNVNYFLQRKLLIDPPYTTYRFIGLKARDPNREIFTQKELIRFISVRVRLRDGSANASQ